MAYKDKDKQREADKERQRRYRERIGYVRAGYKPSSELGVNKGVTKGVIRTAETVNPSHSVTLKVVTPEPERTAKGNIRVSKPGDDDYEPQCETTRAFIEGRGKDIKCYVDLPSDVQRAVGPMPADTHARRLPKRGKDIKCFEDLPLDVQATIVRMSTNDGKVDEAEKAKRTAAAIRYQHIFPERYVPNHFSDVSNKVTGVV